MAVVSVLIRNNVGGNEVHEKSIPGVPDNLEAYTRAFFDMLENPHEPEPKPAIDLQEAALTIDRFRDCISSYYGFKRDLIKPVFIADPKSPTADCAFDVMGIGYELHRGKLTCTGEVKDDER